MFAPANPTSDSLCAFGTVARGVRKLQFLGRSVRLVVVGLRCVRLYECSRCLLFITVVMPSHWRKRHMH